MGSRVKNDNSSMQKMKVEQSKSVNFEFRIRLFSFILQITSYNPVLILIKLPSVKNRIIWNYKILNSKCILISSEDGELRFANRHRTFYQSHWKSTGNQTSKI